MTILQKYALSIPEHIRRKIDVLGRPCIWNIVAHLNSLDDKTINITSLITKLNSNYNHIIKCVELMKSLDMIQEVRVGRVRLIKLNVDNEFVKAIIDILGL